MIQSNAWMRMKASSIWSDSRTQRWFLVGLFLFFVAISIQYSFKVLTPKRDGHTASAVLRWASQIQLMDEGEDVHKSHNYPNPPIMAMILFPISELAIANPLAGALTWFYLKVAMAFLCMYWVFRLVETPENPFPVWAKILTLILSVRPIMGDLTHGNVNIFILFTVIAALYSFSRGYDLFAGILLALSIACKVTPALFIGYFLWKGAWRVLLGCALGLVLFFLVVPSFWLGWEQNWQALNSWIRNMILPFLVGGVVTPEHNNQSLPGLIVRLLTDAPSFSTYIADEYTPIRYDNLASLSPTVAKWIVRGFMLLFVLLVIWRCRAPIQEPGKSKSDTRRNWPLAMEYSIILVGMLLFSERTWKHHCVTLLLPFAVLCYGLTSNLITASQRRWLVGGIATAMLLITSTSTGLFWENPPKLHDLVEQSSVIAGPAPVLGMTNTGALTDSPAKTTQVFGAYVWAFFVLLVGLTILPRPQRKIAELPTTSSFQVRKVA